MQLSQDSTKSPRHHYLAAQPIPRHIKNQVQIYFEEQLYTLALTILTNTLASGISSQNSPDTPRYLPPPSHLAFISVLIVSPRTTTRAETLEAKQAATLAQAYLQNVLRTTGALNANFAEAFQFHQQEAPRRTRIQRTIGTGGFLGSDDGVLGSTDHSDVTNQDLLSGHAAMEQNLWGNSTDFWAVVGWAMNCSVLHPKRWECWREWLTFMVDVLMADWEQNVDVTEELDHNEAVALMKKSLLSKYISAAGARNAGSKLIRRALFADGKNGTSSIFPEVFAKETKGVPKHDIKHKAGSMDLENGKFGDYDSDDTSDEGLPDVTKLPLDSSFFDIPEADDGDLNDKEIELYVDSVPLRLRLMGLLSNYTLIFPNEFISLFDLWEQLARDIRQLPFKIFQAFTEISTTPLTQAQYLYFVREIFRQLLPNNHLRPDKVSREVAENGSIDSVILEKSYLPNTAITITLKDNVQLQHICEQTLLCLGMSNNIAYSKTLERAAQQGLEARLKKCATAMGSKKLLGSNIYVKRFMEQASERMTILLHNMQNYQ